MKEKRPIFQPPSMISTVLGLTKGMLEESRKQLGYMGEVKDKPHILDDETISRSIKLYREQNEDSAFFIKQCKIWRQEKLTELQLLQVQEIEECTHLLTDINNELLGIFTYCRDHTIDKIMQKDDLELALDFLSGKLTLPKG